MKMNNKIIIILFVAMFLVAITSFALAENEEFDNTNYNNYGLYNASFVNSTNMQVTGGVDFTNGTSTVTIYNNGSGLVIQ